MDNITQIWKKIQSPEFNPATDMGLVEQVKQVAMTSQEPAKVSFGTSGWRGEIGSEFTLRNLQVVGAAIVRLYMMISMCSCSASPWDGASVCDGPTTSSSSPSHSPISVIC